MKAAIIIFAICIIGVHSITLSEEQKAVLRGIHNVCAAEAGLNPYEIGIIVKAINSTGKLVEASKCVKQKLINLKEEQSQPSIANLPLPVSDILANCESLLGKVNCEKVLRVISVIAENINRSRNPLLRGP